MRLIAIIILTYLFSFTTTAKDNKPWYSFYNKDSTLIGFKDSAGLVKIPPKFCTLTRATTFQGIMAVCQSDSLGYKGYYLSESLQEAARDSLYIYDNAYDCQSEGYIRFKDPKTALVGMLDSNAKVVIPAVYNDLSKVQNNLVVARKGAFKTPVDTKDPKSSEHYFFNGGTLMLLNQKGEILLNDFDYSESLNLYSLQISPYKTSDPKREYFKTEQGDYYSFINTEKEFLNWFEKDFLKDLSLEKLIDSSFDLHVWHKQKGWVKVNNNRFLTDNYPLIQNELNYVLNNDSSYFITLEELNAWIFDSKDFKEYYNDCQEGMFWKYPVIDVVVNTQSKNGPYQSHYQFLRTLVGYKLISVTLKNLVIATQDLSLVK